jgi:triosephosphate isomerase|tara:strand:+ start:481 stop:1200 length:720 start_codon:yes stop_codon:yes gene_type:complete
MSKLFVANFKMHGTEKIIDDWFLNFDIYYSHFEGEYHPEFYKNLIIALPATHICRFRGYGFTLSGQNVSSQESGAYTSQISAKMLKDSGASHCIIGHSEAREQLSETNEAIREKFNQLKKMKMNPIVCVGESLQIKESGKTKDHLRSQLSVLDAETENLIIAYEPIWAIGTGLVPSETEINDAIDCIRDVFKKPIKVLYGGSVKASNAKNLLDNTDINGLLVGGASLNPQEFGKIAQLC